MAEELSKSAKKRAAKKTRDAAAGDAVEVPAAPAAPAAAQPKAKAKAAASAPAAAAAAGYPEPKAKAKAKAEPKAAAVAAAEPAAPAAAQPKAKGKAKAQPAKAQPAPAAAQPQEEEKKRVEDMIPTEVDDGTGGSWDVCDGLTDKKRKQKNKKAEDDKIAAAERERGSTGNRHIPGLTPLIPGQHIPGMAPPGSSKPAASQAVGAAPKIDPVKEAPKVESSSATVTVPEARVGIVIGPKGATIKLIQEKTGTRIDTSDQIFTITGPAEGVRTAEQAVKDLVTKGYTALAYEDFNENYILVAKENFPDLIGKGGKIVIALKTGLGVEINFPDTSTTKNTEGKKFKVGIAGKTENVEKAKEVINDIVMFGHHEITHPGEVHEEIEVPEWAYSAIIGKKGSELRHIQNSWKVKVSIPRENSANQNVVVTGEKADVPRAKAYIERAVANFGSNTGGRDKADKADDGWGDEAPVEDWMKQYMYKR